MAGIPLASQFNVNAALPLDNRLVLADVTARNAITSGIRYQGMKVFTVSEQKSWVLKTGIANSDWTEDGGSGVGGINYIDNGGDNSTGASVAKWNAPYNDADFNLNGTADTLTGITGRGFYNGMPISFSNLGTVTGLSTGVTYYLVNVGVSTAQLAATVGGSAINFTNTSAVKATATYPYVGLGGTAVTTWGVSTVAPLRGSNTFRIVKDAADRSGEGVSYDFTIDQADCCKAGRVEFDFAVVSGTFVTGDCAVYVMDLTTGEKIQPAPFQIQNVLGAQGGRFNGAFQFGTGTVYRLCFHIPTTSALAWTLGIDSVTVSPNTYTTGGFGSGTVPYIPAISGLGTLTNVSFFARRVVDYLHVWGFATAGTTAASLATIPLPPGLSIDPTKVGTNNNTSNPGQSVGEWNGNNPHKGGIVTATATNASVVYFSGSGGALNPSNGSTVLSTGETISVFFAVPIQGWGTSQVLSSETDTRVVAASYVGSDGGTIPTGADTSLNFNTKVFDSHGAVVTAATGGTGTSAWKFVAPVQGIYSVKAGWALFFSAGTVRTMTVYKNGSVFKQIGSGLVNATNTSQITGACEVPLNAGEYVTLYVQHNIGSGALANTSTSVNFIDIFRLSGPAQIAASDSVVAIYNTTVATGSNATTPVQWSNKVKDSHGAVTTGSAWKFTAPISGTYAIAPVFYLGSGTDLTCRVYKNGSADGYVGFASGTKMTGGVVTVQLLAGEFIDVRVPGSGTPANDAGNTISVWRTGNY